MNFCIFVLGVLTASCVVGKEVAPTSVVPPQIKTVPPSDEGNWQYVETVYKETNHRTMVHTLEPLQPSYEVKYLTTSLSTINNQTISTSSVEFATVLNTTVLYDTEAAAIYTYNGNPTYYQTLEFASQKVKYTPIQGSSTTEAVTYTEANNLPFF